MRACLSLPATLPLFLVSPPLPGGKTRHMVIEIAAQLQKGKKKKEKKGGFQVFVDLGFHSFHRGNVILNYLQAEKRQGIERLLQNENKQTHVPPVEGESEPGLVLAVNQCKLFPCLWREGELDSKTSTVPSSLCCPLAGAPAELCHTCSPRGRCPGAPGCPSQHLGLEGVGSGLKHNPCPTTHCPACSLPSPLPGEDWFPLFLPGPRCPSLVPAVPPGPRCPSWSLLSLHVPTVPPGPRCPSGPPCPSPGSRCGWQELPAVPQRCLGTQGTKAAHGCVDENMS